MANVAGAGAGVQAAGCRTVMSAQRHIAIEATSFELRAGKQKEAPNMDCDQTKRRLSFIFQLESISKMIQDRLGRQNPNKLIVVCFVGKRFREIYRFWFSILTKQPMDPNKLEIL
jgi:hypothetical protein